MSKPSNKTIVKKKKKEDLLFGGTKCFHWRFLVIPKYNKWAMGLKSVVYAATRSYFTFHTFIMLIAH